MIERIANYVRLIMHIHHSFLSCTIFLCTGEYVYDDSLTYVYNKSDLAAVKDSGIFDNNYTKLMLRRSVFWRLVTWIVRFFLFKRSFRINKGDGKQIKFCGNVFIPGTNGKENKIFDLTTNQILLFYSDKQAYLDKLVHYNQFQKYFTMPAILSNDDRGLFIIEEFIHFKQNNQWNERDCQVVIEDVFYKETAYLKSCENKKEYTLKSPNELLENLDKRSPIIDFILSNINTAVLDVRFPFVELHGDLWSSNILIKKNHPQKIYYIDWESSNSLVFFYDLFFMLLNECFIQSNYIYAEKYMSGEYDEKLETVFLTFGTKFETEYRIDYLYITLLNQYAERWTLLGKKTERKIMKQWRSVFQRIIQFGKQPDKFRRSPIMLRYIRNIIINIFADNNICILGIDGTGKTSITNELKRILGENAEIQYMGSKDYITGLAQKRLDLENGSKHAASRMINLIAALIEIWYRVIRHWPSSKTIIYDRYAWERYIFLYGIERTLGKILYRTLFPKPRHVFYLYCPAELSFSRKTDILDKKEFIERKKCYDTEFLGDKHITAINTAVNSMDSIVHIISNAYMKKHS